MRRFAIITPMYNAAATIGETINSVLAQTLDDWEWYLMDDGSPDATAQLAEAKLSAEPRAQVVRAGRVGHIGTLRNRALRQVTAQYVCFLDADDRWVPTFLEQQYELLTRTRANVAHTAAMQILDGRLFEPPAKYKGPPVCNPPEMVRHLYPRNPIYSPSVAIETAVLQKEGGFSEHPDHVSVLDLDLWLRLAPKYRFVYHPDRLLHYRVSAQGLSLNPTNQIRNLRGEILALEAAVERGASLPDNSQRLLRRWLSRRQSQYARALLDEAPPELDLSYEAFCKARYNCPFADRYFPFHVLSLAGRRPPYLLHRILRRFRD
jgi:glycosyltransferase involved in cell wall biosynthesis